jgi:hypothetical protein
MNDFVNYEYNTFKKDTSFTVYIGVVGNNHFRIVVYYQSNGQYEILF